MCNARILSINGEDEIAAMDAIKELIVNKFYENDE